MDTSYNFLLGRPWILAAWVVPSTLHQMVKFEHEDQEIVVHGEDEQSIYREPSVPCLEAREGSEHIVYQALEVVVVDQCEEGNPCPQLFLSNASIMVAKEMIRHGYKPEKGLKTSLQGITEPITPAASEKFFGVGFQPTPTDGKWADDRKNNGWQKQIKFKTDISDNIKEEVTKQLKAGVIQVVRYTTWLANVVPVPKIDGKTRVCVDYRDLNKASPKDNFPLANIHILVDNCAKHEIQSFMDCYVGYYQVLMDEEDAEKTAFTIPWGTYCYSVVPFGPKNAGMQSKGTMYNPSAAITLSDWDNEGFHFRYPKHSNPLLTL
ncbi:uncharacterized protein LOC142163251 [Nicotiana tabacum]|uniref:Uncharacterized protein LOC142163251 n=1 Tax=Nicotiana tabacum TaxID=4097 RepID=A0AC58RV82_TOBAC